MLGLANDSGDEGARFRELASAAQTSWGVRTFSMIPRSRQHAVQPTEVFRKESAVDELQRLIGSTVTLKGRPAVSRFCFRKFLGPERGVAVFDFAD